MLRRYALPLPVLALLLLTTSTLLQAQDLHIYMSASSEVVSPGESITYTLTATNTGPVDLLDVSVAVQMPDHINSFWHPYVAGLSCVNGNYCDANEAGIWNVGTLTPGETRTLFYTMYIAEAAPEAVITHSATATASNASDAATSLDASIDPSPLLRLGLTPDPGPAVPGKQFAYRLTVGNTGAASPSGVILRMPLPRGASFVSASDGGSISDGVVTWDLGLFAAASGREVQLTIQVDESLSDGDVLHARATLDPNDTNEYVVRASAVTPVRAGSPLHLRYAVSQNAVGAGDLITITLTASNTGPVDLLDVAARFLMPDAINRFWHPYVPGLSCVSGNYCDANEAGTWNVGTLPPGESRSVTFHIRLQDAAAPGQVLRALLTARGSNAQEVQAGQTLQVDPSPLLHLGLVPGPGPAVPGEPFTYTLTFGNVGSASPSDVQLTMPLPEGTTFVEASGGGTLTEDVVTWNIPLFAAAGVGRARLVVTPDAALADGALLEARAEIDSGDHNEVVLSSTAVTPIQSDSPLHLKYTLAPRVAAGDSTLAFRLIASNTGAVDLLDVAARFLMPDAINRFWHPDVPGLSCVDGNYCDPNEASVWSIGTLPPGARDTLTFTTSVVRDVAPGTILRSPAYATASNSGSNQALAQADVLIGNLITLESNRAPSAATLTSPDDGATFLIGGEDDDPAPPDSAFVIEWTSASDPEGDALTYTWQLSTTNDFGSLLMNEVSAENGAATQFETDFGTLDSLLREAEVDVGTSLTLYHRVLASDGQHSVSSAPFSIELTRGVLVDAEEDARLPHAFALHGNYPNPFSRSTTFAFELPEPAHVTLSVFDLLGREVSTVLSERMAAGAVAHEWHAGALAPGLYVYRLAAGSFTATRKLVVLK